MKCGRFALRWGCIRQGLGASAAVRKGDHQTNEVWESGCPWEEESYGSGRPGVLDIRLGTGECEAAGGSMGRQKRAELKGNSQKEVHGRESAWDFFKSAGHGAELRGSCQKEGREGWCFLQINTRRKVLQARKHRVGGCSYSPALSLTDVSAVAPLIEMDLVALRSSAEPADMAKNADYKPVFISPGQNTRFLIRCGSALEGLKAQS
ncbi:hypothetical protein B0H19DRAFT_1061288 [Mycena capillaripes]|nr:hypothetical protein B0H19DRAFT_1061288 [Mycena capillaripes]